VPYATELPPGVLFESLHEGTIPPAYIPHLRTLLQEAPAAILADLADELHRKYEVPKPDTWKRMRSLAAVLKCDRPLWQNLQT
jgi:hypothetical protein